MHFEKQITKAFLLFLNCGYLSFKSRKISFIFQSRKKNHTLRVNHQNLCSFQNTEKQIQALSWIKFGIYSVANKSVYKVVESLKSIVVLV